MTTLPSPQEARAIALRILNTPNWIKRVMNPAVITREYVFKKDAPVHYNPELPSLALYGLFETALTDLASERLVETSKTYFLVTYSLTALGKASAEQELGKAPRTL